MAAARKVPVINELSRLSIHSAATLAELNTTTQHISLIWHYWFLCCADYAFPQNAPPAPAALPPSAAAATRTTSTTATATTTLLSLLRTLLHLYLGAAPSSHNLHEVSSTLVSQQFHAFRSYKQQEQN